MAVDIVIVASALIVIGPERSAYSASSAIALNVVVLAYHRPGRYAWH